jgi:hypothetical protein
LHWAIALPPKPMPAWRNGLLRTVWPKRIWLPLALLGLGAGFLIDLGWEWMGKVRRY